MLCVKHIELKDANEFVERYHRHHNRVAGHRFSLAAYDGERLCGVAIVGRPVARAIDQHDTVEVLRLCTDGTYNACSFLYGAVKRAARALGFSEVITYTLDTEPGTTLRASGFSLLRVTDGGAWNCPSRPRCDHAPTCRKKFWSVRLS